MFAAMCGCSSEKSSASSETLTGTLPVLTDAASTPDVSQPEDKFTLTAEDIRSLKAGSELSENDLTQQLTDQAFFSMPIPQDVISRIDGVSYRENPDISLDDLRYIKVLHYTSDKTVKVGELIVNKNISEDILDIFRELFNEKYPIERMVLIDEYGRDDVASMSDNNTSAFNYRVVANTSSLSNHALGLAIDVNPLYNPYITFNSDGSENVSPSDAKEYSDRNGSFPMKISDGDLCLRLFKEHGFDWGGDWKSCKDYQHFEKTAGFS